MADTVHLPSDASPLVGVLLIVTRERALVERCLRALADAHDPAVPTEVVLILNRPDPATRAWVRAAVRGAIVVDTGDAVRLGTAPAYNSALALTAAPLVLTTHEDAAADPGWLAPLVAAVRGGAGVAGPRQHDREGRFRELGWVLSRSGRMTAVGEDGLPGARTRTTPLAVDNCPSSCALIDRDVLEAAGGFEERLNPVTYLDADVSTAAWAQGRPAMIVPTATVRHDRGAMQPTPVAARFVRFLLERNQGRFREKWASRLTGHTDVEGPAGVQDALARAAVRTGAAAQRPVADRSISGAGGLVQGDDGWWRPDAALATAGLRAELDVRRAYGDHVAEGLIAADELTTGLWQRIAETDARLAQTGEREATAWARVLQAEAAAAQSGAREADLWQRIADAEAREAGLWQRITDAEAREAGLWQRIVDGEAREAEAWARVVAAEARLTSAD